MTTPSGTFPPSKICLDTQHFIVDEQIPGISKIASQKPDSLSATQTPGHFSVWGKIKETRNGMWSSLSTLFQKINKQ